MHRASLFLLTAGLALGACSGGDDAGPAAAQTAEVAPHAAAPDPGRHVFDHWCLPCHAAGPGHPGTNRLAERLGPEHAVILERTDLDADHVKDVVRNGFQMMPPFRYTEISDPELKAVAAYVVSHGKATEN